MIFLVTSLIFFINLIVLSKYTKSSFNLSVSFVLLFLMFAYLNQQNFSNENKNENNDQNNLAEESSIVGDETLIKSEVDEYLNLSKKFSTSYLGNFYMGSKYFIQKYHYAVKNIHLKITAIRQLDIFQRYI